LAAPTARAEHRSNTYGIRVTHADERGEIVVRLDGELELANAALVRGELERALATGRERIVVDLRGLGFLDSTGIRALVDAHDRCKSSARSLTLLLEPGAVHRTLSVCGLLDVIDHVTAAQIAA